jgi:hypothetical protein
LPAINNIKLIQVLKSFSREEFKEFEKFAASPYFSKGRNLMPLLKELKKFYPEFNQKNFVRENIASRIGKQGKNAGRDSLKTQVSCLYKMACEYMTVQALKTLPGIESFLFVNTCKQKKLYGIAEKAAGEKIHKIKNTDIDWRHYLNYYYLMVELVNISFIQDKPLKAFERFNNLSETVLHQFLCLASRPIFNLTYFKRVYNKQDGGNLLLHLFNKAVWDNILEATKLKNDVYSKASVVYLSFILMTLNPDNEEYYSRFKKYLFNNIEIFSEYEKSGFFQFLGIRTDYLMKEKEFRKYAQEAFEIINFRLSRNLHKQYASAPYTAGEYFSAFYTGFAVNDIKWMEEFIKKYSYELPAEHRQPVSKLSRAFLQFAKEDYPGALGTISTTKGLPFILNYELKRLQLMSFYEAGMISEAFYGLDAFKNYLKSNKNVAQDFMESHMNFIMFYQQILKYKLKEEDFELAKLKNEIENSDTGNKDWLLKKIEQLNRR